jgi:prophage tail gpP-like protein
MERFKDFQQLVSGFSDTEWLVDCAAMPSINMRQAQIDLILLEIIRREAA